MKSESNEAKRVRLQVEAGFLDNRADYYKKIIKTIRMQLSVVKLDIEFPEDTHPCWIIIPPKKL